MITFETSQKKRQAPEVPFELDGREIIAKPPKQIAWASLLRISNRKATPDEMLSGPGLFLEHCLSVTDSAWIESRLLNRDDDLDLTDLLPIINALVEEWEPYLQDDMAALVGGSGNRANRRNGSRTPARRTAAQARTE